MNKIFLILILSTVSLFSNEKPNIVFVLFDDMGYGEPTCYRKDSQLKTPQIDRICSSGMRFTDAHSASAVCTPTRYGVLTGRYPARIGQYGVLETFNPPIIPESRLTVASFLKNNGYDTACVGKWHLGLAWEKEKSEKVKGKETLSVGSRFSSGPNQLGFDYFYGYTHARNIQAVLEQDRVVEIVKDTKNQLLMIEKAVAWLEKRDANKPFFLYFPMCPPHTPIIPSDEFIGKSNAKDVIKNDPKYGDWLYQGDNMLGQILDTLDKKGFTKNTLIIVTSDNGASGRPYAPLRDAKTSIYEGGHRVPFIASWQGKILPGSVSNQTICLNDLMATCADILKVKLPENAGEDSVSILPALLGTTKEPLREATLHIAMNKDIALRQGDWKLIIHHNGKSELYNLREDLSETKNVISENKEIADKMTALLVQYIKNGRSTPGASQPVDDFVKWPLVIR